METQPLAWMAGRVNPWRAVMAVAFLLVATLVFASRTQAAAPCDPPIANAVVCENSKTGDPPAEWDVSGAGDASIQGYATDISVDQGETVHFKVDTAANDYRLDIYRMGYYGGDGARRVATQQPSASLPQSQPACATEDSTGLIDCGNWSESASWAVPADAVSGIYFAKLVREDAAGASHVVFIVRDDDGGSDLLFQTGDTTWQAYNQYGGNSLYTGSPAGRAYKVSYNRPFTVRGNAPEDWMFNAEYPMVRFLEANGYDVSYFSGIDTDRRGAELLEHNVFLSLGHDEYWSGGQRANVEAARAAGVHLAFFSGNEVFWKTRWEDSHRTLVSYKETHANAKVDPLPNVWTGTWRDPRAFNPEGPRPENALTGQIFTVNCCTYAIEVPAADGKMRLWRDTSIAGLAPDGVATLSGSTLGYEWDEDLDNGARPPGVVRMSTTTVDVQQRIQDHGSSYGLGQATHHLTLYRHSSGALVFGAGTVQWSWGLDGNHDRGGSTPDARMRQATVNLFADMGVQPVSLQAGLVSATASLDVTAPGSQVESPAAGANVEAGTPVTVTGTATDSGGGRVGGVEVSVDGGDTWHPAQGRENWSYSWTPGGTGQVTLKSRAVDDSGRLEVPGGGVTVTVAPKSCPCSIWGEAIAGGVVDSDTNAVELGVRFRSDQDGFITGLRFYKHAANTGTHMGHLWTNGGTMLAEATFAGESASGWQEVTLGAPVEVQAGTTYVASYHAPAGRYAATGGYFASSGADSPPLHAPRDGVDGSNGVYRYGPPGFPNETFNASNYWVDVVFNETATDDTPPTIASVSPTANASGVNASTNVTATFSEGLDATTVNTSTFELRDSANALVPATVTYSAAPRRATLDPDAALQHSQTYRATVKGGAGGVKDLAGHSLANDFSWSFTTAAPPPPPPDEGPGGPILVISSSSNPFGRYYAEILRAEGLNAFTATDISAVTAGTLAAHDVAILGDMPLTTAQVTMLSDWVQGGGNLIAMRPDKQLAGLLGLTDDSAALSNAYLKVDTSSGAGAGIVGDSIQFHGTADRYTATGAVTIANLFSNGTTATTNPAVTLRGVGSNGGQAAAFTYDLARSVVYTRQGNPAWAGQERDGESGPIRSDDLFFGNAGFDPQPDWVDFSKIAIPQADEQQRLLANLIGRMNLDRKPLPRFWYLPRNEKAAVVMTGDDHGNGGTAGRFDTYKAQSPTGCSVAEWECVRASSYIYVNTPLTDAQAAGYHADGFEIALHPNTDCANWTPASLDQFFDDQLGSFAAKYTSIPAPSTNRTHCIAWSDWATHPKVELNHGMRLDTNYYYWPQSWIQDRPGLFTGSAMPMRFADLDGSMIDVYQATTQMTDESGQSYPLHANTLLDRAIGPEGYYGVFTANMHTDSSSHPSSDAIVASAQTRGVPVVSGRQMQNWLDGRNGSSFKSLAWNANKLTFSIEVGAGANGLRAMVPTSSAAGDLTGIKRDGTPINSPTQTIKGVEYAFIEATAGAYEATYAVDDTPPLISNRQAAPNSDGTATITWTTNEPSDSRVDYGTAPGSLTSNRSQSGLRTSHSVELTGLAPNTTYHYRVTSADGAANAAVSPVTSSAPASFTTPSASFVDTTTADFGAGSAGAGAYLGEEDDGELLLNPEIGSEFSGSSLPAGWSAPHDWGGGGTATVSGGKLTVDGARVNTDATFLSGRSIEFAATFAATPFQIAGFGFDLNDQPWAIFSTQGDGNLYARTHNGASVTNTPLPSSLLGSSHRYRIDWNAGSVEFFVDSTLVATHVLSFGSGMRPVVSDFNAGGPSIVVDWMRMSPYAGSGAFTSGVFDAGTAANWGALSWLADTPAGTGVSLSVRTGNTSVPDGTWSGFGPISASGQAIGGNSRYIQYRAQLASGDANETAVLREVEIGYAEGVDREAPTIAGRLPAPGAPDASRTSNVAVTFSEPMNPATIDGSTVRLRAEGAGADVPATVSYAGATATLDPSGPLAASTAYRVTVAGSVEDEAGNQLGTDDTWSFTTAAPAPSSLVDTTVGDFGAGTTGNDTYVSETSNGEVTLKPAVGEEFSGAALPSGWSAAAWNPPAGGASVSAGRLTVDGARAHPDALFTSGRSLEFLATFDGAAFQHVGFAIDFNEPVWAMFSTGSGGRLLARTNNNAGSQAEFEIPGSASLLGSPHRYRIDWNATSVEFFIDDVSVFTQSLGYSQQLRPIVSDFNSGGGVVSVDWLRMSSYPGSGTFTSRVFDAGTAADWRALSWTAQRPTGTTVAVSIRTGNTPAPDATWSDFLPVVASGDDIPGNSRYVQYRADLTRADSRLTPALLDLTIGYLEATDTTGPTIARRSPSPNATDVSVGASVSVEFSEPMDRSTINGSTVRLRAQGAGADVAASVTSSGTTATLEPHAPLASNKAYAVTVAGSVMDANGNPLGNDVQWSFTTAPLSFDLVDVTAAHFGGGTTGPDTYVSEIADGEVTLRPTVGEEFSGASVPIGWSTHVWGGGGGAAVSGGKLTVDGARVNTDATFGPGRSLEFVATFGGAPFQAAGFGFDLNDQPWAMFSTQGDGNLYARTHDGTSINTPLPSSLLGSSHRYRIEWNASNVEFFVDETLVATHAATFGSAMRPLVSDFNVGGPGVVIEWMRMSPYPTSGTFVSRVFDAGAEVNWGALTWTAQTPGGTGVALSVRTGDTPTPDGTWTDYTPVASPGGDVPGSSRYLQYRAQLTTGDPDLTPALAEVRLRFTDTNAPTVSINSVTDELLGRNDSSTDVRWSATENGTYSVRVGGTSCTTGTEVAPGSYEDSPAQRTTTVAAAALDEGANTIRVCVTDAAGNTGSATRTVTKDTNAPTVTINSVTDELLGRSDSSTDVRWSATENGPYSVRVGGTSCTTGTEVAPGSYEDSPAQRTTTVAAAALDEGANTIRVCVTDAAGNTGSATRTVTKDTTAPTVTIASVSDDLLVPPDDSTTVRWSATENGSFSLRKRGDSCTTGVEITSGGYTTSPGEHATPVSVSDLDQGPNTLRLCVQDAAGNSGGDTTTVVKLSTAPDVTIDSVSDDLLGPDDSSTAVGWSADQNGAYSVRVGGTSCTTGTEVASGQYDDSPNRRTATISSGRFQEGENTVRVCVENAVGTGSDTTIVRVDTTAPRVTIASVSDSALSASESSTDVIWEADENGGFSVRAGGTNCTTGNQVAFGDYDNSPTRRTTTISAADLADGTIRVCVTDGAGNRGSDTTAVIRDTSAPTVRTSLSKTEVGPEDSSTELTWSADESGSFTVRLGGTDCDGGEVLASGDYTAPGDRATDIPAAKLVEGQNEIRVCVTDTAGNTGSGSVTALRNTAHVRPGAATPLRIPLVVAYDECRSPDRTHGPRLAFPSCSAPAKASSRLTVGTPDINRRAANSIGFVRFVAWVGDPDTAADEADAGLQVSLTDVRRESDLSDYPGETQLRSRVRVTDKRNGTSESVTVSDFTFAATVPCVVTVSNRVGATCSLSTTVDAVMPGAIVEAKRQSWELGQVQLFDGGADDVADTAGNEPFAVGGLFVP